MFDLGKLAFDLVSQLVLGIVQDSLKSSTLSFFERRKVERRVEDATAAVVEGIVPFLEQEKVSQDKQQRLIEACIDELKPLADNPAELFKGSLDGQKIFENLYHDKELPRVIIEDGLKDTYALLFPRIATLLCKIPVAVKDWENEAWSENYRRFDEIVQQLKSLFARVDGIASAPDKSTDETLNRFKRILSQKVGLQLDITGLRADQPLSGKFDDFFVLPVIKQDLKDEKKEPISITDSDMCFRTFTEPDFMAAVIGAPGAGKSTWSKWLQRETLRADWSGVGVRIEFRDVKSSYLPSVYELVRISAGKQLAEDLTHERIRKWLNEYKVAFIFDGFDEVRPSDRDIFVKWLDEINEVAKGCPFVVTSRPLTTDHLDKLGGNLQEWSIEPFDEERVITYISRWYVNTPLLTDNKRVIDAKEIGVSWLEDKTIGPLTGNPLLLSTLLMVHHLDGKLPNGRTNLYKRYIDGMLGIWDDRYKQLITDIQLTPDEKRKILRGIALHLFLLEQETIDENMLIDWLKDFLPKINIVEAATDVLVILRERSGLIVGPGVYSFSHKTIAEFLVAENVLQGDQKGRSGERFDRFLLYEYRGDDRWNTVLFLWAGIVPFADLEAFINSAMKSQDYELAFGLISDQYDRFPRESRLRFMLELKKVQKKKWGHNFSWVSYFYNNSDDDENTPKIVIPTFRIRSLAGGSYEPAKNTVAVLVEKAVRDNTIQWDDFSDAKGDVYDLIWSMFAAKHVDLETWQKVLSHRLPRSTPKSSCVKLIAQYALSPNQENLRGLVEIYQDTFPEFSGYVPIALMLWFAVLLFRKDEKEKRDSELINNYFSQSVEIILQEDPERVCQFVDDVAYLDTHFHDEAPEFPKHDLLSLFIYAIDYLADEKLIDLDNSKKEEIIDYIDRLKMLAKIQ